MTTTTANTSTAVSFNPKGLGLAFVLIVFFLLVIFKSFLPESFIRPTETLIFPLADWINSFFTFLQEDLGLTVLTRAIADAVQWMLDVVRNILLGGRKGFGLPALPWITLALVGFMLGYYLKGTKLGLFAFATFTYLAVFGQWKEAMQTFGLVLVTVPLAIMLGLLFGVLAYKRKWFENLLIPILNVTQSLPHFSYLIPVVVFFGVGHHAGAIATVIFATPPMIRMVLLGLKKVSPEVTESGHMSGCTNWQLLRHVQIPSARHEILVGINQVIMQCLAMVVIASFIGAPGLGYKLLLMLQGLKIGKAIELGVSIVLIAIMLDRLSLAWVEKQPEYHKDEPFLQRYRYLLITLGLFVISIIAANLVPYLYKVPRTAAISTAPFWDSIVDWITLNWFDAMQAFRRFLSLEILIPMRDAYLSLPYLAVVFLVCGLGYLVGKWRSVIIVGCYIMFIAVSGWWDRAMITAYMVTCAVIVCVILGVCIGIIASRNPTLSRAAIVMCDTFQTFPSFIYLIPVIMLFQVNDVSAIFAVIIYGMIPSIRYTIEGLRQVPDPLHEATIMSGANGLQRLVQLELPLALPHILVGINQTVMFSLFMVIIAAFIGTQDLGQEMMRALSFSDTGKGLVLGFCVAFMGLTIDHLVSQWSSRRKKMLGL